VTAPRFIPVQEIRKLSEGSFEHTISKIERAVQESSERIFGKKIGARVVGTFPENALALSEDGDVARVFWAVSKDGSVKIVKTESVKIASYSPENVEDFARKQIRKAVAAWESGRKDEAERLISEVAPYVDERPLLSDAKVVEALTVEFKAARPWRQILKANRQRFESAVGEPAMMKIAAESSGPKYTVIYNGSMEEAERAGYLDLVHSDFSYLTSRVTSLRDLSRTCYEGLRSVVRSEDLKADETISTFITFTEDLVSDLSRLQKIVSDAPKTLTKIESLGRLYDTINEGLPDYELAGKFVETMSKQLQDAAKAK
jgi:hypothetical protein